MSPQMRNRRESPMDPEVVRRMRSTKRYQRFRAGILQKEPLCRACSEAGFTVGAEHIDHIEPVHLAPERFWDRDNIQPICRECHERQRLRTTHPPARESGRRGTAPRLVLPHPSWSGARSGAPCHPRHARCCLRAARTAPRPGSRPVRGLVRQGSLRGCGSRRSPRRALDRPGSRTRSSKRWRALLLRCGRPISRSAWVPSPW